MEGESSLRQFFTDTQPLGKVGAEDHPSVESRSLFQAYFDRENYSFKSLKQNPVMIVGRKGAGKTEFLLSYFYDNMNGDNPSGRFDPLIHFNDTDSANMVSIAVRQISDAINTSRPPPMVESVTAFWDGLFWICIMAGITISGKWGQCIINHPPNFPCRKDTA